MTARGGIVLHTAGSGPIDVFAHDGRGVVNPAAGTSWTRSAPATSSARRCSGRCCRGWSKGRGWGVDQVLPAVRTGAAAAHIACQRAGAEPPSLSELTARVADLAV